MLRRVRGLPSFSVGSVIDERYEVRGVIGTGGVAMVLDAYDRLTDRNVACKVLHPVLAVDPTLKKRFEQEIRLLATVRHPNVVEVLDMGLHDATPYLVLAYYGPETLSDVIARAPMKNNEVVACGLQLASALRCVHLAGLVHRDVKPSNILVSTDDGTRPKYILCDFGHALIQGAQVELTPAGVVIGTPQYASPEQIVGDPLDGRSDMFTLAVTLLEAAIGRYPFGDPSTPVAVCLTRIVDPTWSLPTTGDGPLDDILGRALHRNREERYGDVAGMYEALAALRI